MRRKLWMRHHWYVRVGAMHDRNKPGMFRLAALRHVGPPLDVDYMGVEGDGLMVRVGAPDQRQLEEFAGDLDHDVRAAHQGVFAGVIAVHPMRSKMVRTRSTRGATTANITSPSVRRMLRSTPEVIHQTASATTKTAVKMGITTRLTPAALMNRRTITHTSRNEGRPW